MLCVIIALIDHFNSQLSAAFFYTHIESDVDYDPSLSPVDICPDIEASDADAWYADTGTTHHITSRLDSVSDARPYTRSYTAMVGNGKHLSIQNVGSGFGLFCKYLICKKKSNHCLSTH